jgi:short-subunit dehydrogenase
MPDATRPLAVVTGASSGIGLELAREFARHGYDLLIAAEDARLDAAADAIRAEGSTVESARVDLATREGVDELVARIRAQGRPVEAVAINAGIGVGGPFVETDLEAELRLVALNVTGVVQLSKHIVRDMVSAGRGRILYTSSIAGDMPAPYLAVYGASKAFDLSFAEALRHEMKDTGVTITVLQPGPTDTDFFRRADMEDTKVATAKKDDPAEVARQGFEALMAGKDHVVAGSFKNRVQDALAQVLPETAKAAAHAKQAEPGSGRKGAKKK